MDFPKSPFLIQRIVSIASGPDDLVLDFFAASGTTGHAVMAQNVIDGGRRRFILVQLPEPLDPESNEQKAASDFCDSLSKPRTIAEITKERLRRASHKMSAEAPMLSGDNGFKVFKLATSNIGAWDPMAKDLAGTLLEAVEHIQDGRTDDDILNELMLKLGLDLAVPMEQRVIHGKKVHSIGGGVLLVCLDSAIGTKDYEPLAMGIAAWHKELAPAGETTLVFRDSAFADDVAKSNLTAILNQHGLDNVRSL
ncbi:MAG: hypothetical protein IPF72_20210 [Chitinophagaceae bacterium]|nr:hypothetical protein [Chitinophagaceae bacterium]